MLRLLNLGLNEYAEKKTFLGLLTSIILKSTGFPLRTFFETLDTYTKKNNPRQFWGGGEVAR